MCHRGRQCTCVSRLLFSFVKGVSTVSHAGQLTLDEAAILSKLPSGTKVNCQSDSLVLITHDIV